MVVTIWETSVSRHEGTYSWTLEDWPICAQCHVLWIHRKKFCKVLGIHYGLLFSYWRSWKSQARHKIEQDGINENLLEIGSKNQETGLSRWFPVASCCTPPPRAYSSIGMQCLSSLQLHQECSKYRMGWPVWLFSLHPLSLTVMNISAGILTVTVLVGGMANYSY